MTTDTKTSGNTPEFQSPTFGSKRCAMARFTLALLLVFGCLAGSSSAQEQKPDETSAPPGQRVFFASHSLMWYAPKPLGEMAEAAGIKGHKLIGLQSLGASKTLQHWNLPDDKNEVKKAVKTGEVGTPVLSPAVSPVLRSSPGGASVGCVATRAQRTCLTRAELESCSLVPAYELQSGLRASGGGEIGSAGVAVHGSGASRVPAQLGVTRRRWSGPPLEL